MNTPNPPRVAVTARPGLLSRLRLSEPIRLYSWPLVVVLVLSAVAGGWATQDWADWALPQLAAALGTLGAAEAGRASVFSTQTHVQDLMRARGSWAVPPVVPAADSRPVFRTGAR